MKKSLELLHYTFESSTGRTPQYLTYHRTFKREFTKLLNSLGVTIIQISKPNHFDASGFFRAPNGQAYWFRIEDLRWSKEMLIRTAKDFKDYTGGHNQYIPLTTPEEFTNVLKNIAKL